MTMAMANRNPAPMPNQPSGRSYEAPKALSVIGKSTKCETAKEGAITAMNNSRPAAATTAITSVREIDSFACRT